MVAPSIALWVLILTASDGPTLEVAWDVDRLEGTPGDTVSVSLHVGWDGDHTEYTLRPPTPDPRSGLAVGPTTTTQRLGTGRTEWVFTYRFVPTQPGDPTIPPMSLRYVTKGSDAWEETRSQEIALTIRESRQPSKPPSSVLVGVGAVTAGLALACYLYVAHRRKRTHRASDPLAEEALGRIAAYENIPSHVAFCQGVSEVVRSYLAQKLGLVVRGKATTETLRDVEKLLPPDQLDSVRAVLEDCDRGRFSSIGDAEARSRILRNCMTLLTGESAHEH
jgi:hypothetical protein